MWLPFVMQLKLFTVYRTDVVHVVQPTGTVQPQTCPTML